MCMHYWKEHFILTFNLLITFFYSWLVSKLTDLSKVLDNKKQYLNQDLVKHTDILLNSKLHQ